MKGDTQPTGRRKSALARKDALSPERRRDIAKDAAVARWGLKATHRGNFQDDFGIDVDCYVLNDVSKTAVISQRGMGAAIGLSARGNSFPRFAGSQAIAPYLSGELQEKIQKPLKFQWEAAGAVQPPSEIHGYDVTLLIDVCKAIMAADVDSKLAENQKGLATQARILVNASAKSGIQNLVYRIVGYDATKQEAVAAFKFYVREEAREYEKEFPDMLYSEWYRLYQLPHPERNKPWKFMHLTVDHVYWPLAKSSGKVLELMQVQRLQSKERYKKLHQFLSEIGVKALRTQLGQLLGIARISKTQADYEMHVKTLFGDQMEMDFTSDASNQPPSFSPSSRASTSVAPG